MRRSFILTFPLMLLVSVIAFTGCENGLSSAAGTAALNTGRATADTTGPEFPAAIISGTLTVVDGVPMVQYQGNNYYVKGSLALPGEGTALTITGEAVPILDRDAEDNSLFFGYYLKAEKVTVN
jgi:hypothetical protein